MTVQPDRMHRVQEMLWGTRVFTEANRILIEHDPAGMIEVPAAQRDEYEWELIRLLPTLAEAHSSEDVRRELRGELVQSCGGSFLLRIPGEERLSAAAWALWQLWQSADLGEREYILSLIA